MGPSVAALPVQSGLVRMRLGSMDDGANNFCGSLKSFPAWDVRHSLAYPEKCFNSDMVTATDCSYVCT